MQTASLPRCPKCADGGNVVVAQVCVSEDSIFKPLPSGAEKMVPMFQCDCGWEMPVADVPVEDKPFEEGQAKKAG